MCCTFWGCQQSPQGVDHKQPNVILIMADDLGFETLTANGGESYQSPRLDQLAKEGIRFTHAYATPLCTPSRVQIMTGKYNFRNYEQFGYLNPEEKTFGNYLRDAGYQTAIVGKWQLGGTEQTPIDVGFNNYCLWQLYKGDYWYRYKSPRIIQDGVKLSDTLMTQQYGPDVFTNYILDFISQHQDTSFLVYYPMALVHDPFQPTPELDDYNDFELVGTNDTTYFRNLVANMDYQVGRIVDHLNELGIANNTVLLFTGDNGTDRKVVSHFQGQQIKGHKGYTTDAGTHVPMIAYAPGRIKPGQLYENLVDFTDILPTLLSITDIQQPSDNELDGFSFWQNLTGQNQTAPRSTIFCSYRPRTGKFTPQMYAQDKTYKLYSDGRLYRYLDDPQEQAPIPLDELNPEIISRHLEPLRAKLDEHSAQKQHFMEKE